MSAHAVPGKSLGPVALGSTRNEVVEVLQEASLSPLDWGPTSIREGSVYTSVVTPSEDLIVAFRDDLAYTAIATTPRFGRTAEGVTVGMRWLELPDDLRRTLRWDSDVDLFICRAAPGLGYEFHSPPTSHGAPDRTAWLMETYEITNPQHAEIAAIHVYEPRQQL